MEVCFKEFNDLGTMYIDALFIIDNHSNEVILKNRYVLCSCLKIEQYILRSKDAKINKQTLILFEITISYN